MIKKGILMLFFVLTFGFLSGCELLLQNDLTLFAETYKNMAETKNFEMDFSLNIEINSEEIANETTTILYDFESDEVGNMKVDVLGMPMYIEVTENNMNTYFKIGTAWYKSTMSKEELGVDTTIESDDYSFLTGDDLEYKLVEETDTYNVYEFSLSDSAFLTDQIEAIQTELLSQLNLTEDEFNDLIDSFTLLVTIDKEAKLITKMELDLTEMLNAALNPETEEPTTTTAETTTQEVTTQDSTASASTPVDTTASTSTVVNGPITVDQFYISIEFKNYNKVDVTISEEMKAAQTFSLFE